MGGRKLNPADLMSDTKDIGDEEFDASLVSAEDQSSDGLVNPLFFDVDEWTI